MGVGSSSGTFSRQEKHVKIPVNTTTPKMAQKAIRPTVIVPPEIIITSDALNLQTAGGRINEVA